MLLAGLWTASDSAHPFEVGCDQAFPLVSVGEQFVLVIYQLFSRLGRELQGWTFDDGIDRAIY